MRHFLSISVLSLSLVLGGCASTQQALTATAIGVERMRAGLDYKTVQVGEFDIPYLEGGQGPVVFMIHGFQSNKDIWVRFAGQLTSQYHVYAIDLPAHGDSNILMDKSYTITEQARRVAAIMDALKLVQPVHVMGHSMGGAIAFTLAANYPAHVKTLALINSAGVISPKPSELQRELEQGKNPLIVHNEDDYRAMLAFTMSEPPYIPGPMMATLAHEAVEREPIANRIFGQLDPKLSPPAPEVLARIRVPTWVLWGNEDKVLEVSSTEVFKQYLPRSEVLVFKGVGHAPPIERPKEMATAYRSFLSRTQY
jgi:abhydrolase domain-containing protein 6